MFVWQEFKIKMKSKKKRKLILILILLKKYAKNAKIYIKKCNYKPKKKINK